MKSRTSQKGRVLTVGYVARDCRRRVDPYLDGTLAFHLNLDLLSNSLGSHRVSLLVSLPNVATRGLLSGGQVVVSCCQGPGSDPSSDNEVS